MKYIIFVILAIMFGLLFLRKRETFIPVRSVRESDTILYK